MNKRKSGLIISTLLISSLAIAQQAGFSSSGVIKTISSGMTVLATSINGKLSTPESLKVNDVIVTVSLYNATHPMRWIDTTSVGSSFCIYVVAINSAGKAITGLRPVITSSNTSVGTIIPSATCPDTTIDPSKLP